MMRFAWIMSVLAFLWNGTSRAADMPTVTPEKLSRALADLKTWVADESRKDLYYSKNLQPMPMDETLKAIDKNGYNNIYGYGYLHWILKKAAKFVSLLFPGRFVTVLRVNSTYPYANPTGSQDAHDRGLDVDMGYILLNPNDATSMIDYEAEFWLAYMLYAEAKLVTSHRYSGFSYIHEMESYLDMAISRSMVPTYFRFSAMTDPWEFSHISHFHFGINACTRTITRTEEGPRCP